MRIALKFTEAGDHARAIADYTKALELNSGPFKLEFYAKRAEAFMASGDYNSAAADYTSAIDVDPKHVQLSDRNSTTAELFDRRAMARLGAGKPADALHDSEHSLALWPGEPSALTTHGRVLEALGRRDEAIAEFQRALTNAPDYADAKAALAKLGVAAKPPDEMQALLKHVIDLDHADKPDEAIAAGEGYAHAVEQKSGVGGPEYAFALDVLVDLYISRNDLEGAERAARQALAARQAAPVPDPLEIAKELTNLAVVLNAAGKYAEAEPSARTALEMRERALDPNHPRLAESLNNVAVLNFRQGRLAEAETLERRALQIIERNPDALGKPGERLLSVLNSLAAILQAEHRGADADALNRRALEVAQPLEKRRQTKIAEGSPAPSVEASMLGKNSYLFGCGRNWAQVLISAREQTDGRERRPSDRNEVALFHGDDPTEQPLNRARVQALYRMGANDPDIRAEGFLVAQRMLLNDAARAISKLAAQFGSGSGTLASLIREQQDRLDRRSQASKLFHDSYEFGQVSRIAEPEAHTQAGDSEEDKALDAIEAKLKERFPEFIALANPEPLSIIDVQAQLGEDEALVMFKDFEAWANIVPEETFIWVVTKTDSRWVRSALGAKSLGEQVATLRCGLDGANWVEFQPLVDGNRGRQSRQRRPTRPARAVQAAELAKRREARRRRRSTLSKLTALRRTVW